MNFTKIIELINVIPAKHHPSTPNVFDPNNVSAIIGKSSLFAVKIKVNATAPVTTIESPAVLNPEKSKSGAGLNGIGSFC